MCKKRQWERYYSMFRIFYGSFSMFVHRKCDAIIRRRPFFSSLDKDLKKRTRNKWERGREVKTKTDRRNLPSLYAFNKVLRIHQRIEPFDILFFVSIALTQTHTHGTQALTILSLCHADTHLQFIGRMCTCAYSNTSHLRFSLVNISKRQRQRQHLTLHIFLII